MSEQPLFKSASPYQKDVLSLPVRSIDIAAKWYANAFGLSEVRRLDSPHKTVLMERDGVQIGFSENGGDSSQDGAAIEVSDILRARDELMSNFADPGELGTDERDGNKYRVFFVVAPDGLCYYFYQTIT